MAEMLQKQVTTCDARQCG